MNDYKQKHLEKKNEIVDCLNMAESFFRENGFEHEAEVIYDNKINLENGEFSIAVVGEFSAGKSTLLNALMGEKILPSFSDETTATINYLRHIEHASAGECGEVFYNDGTSEKIYSADLATVSRYVCTESDVDVAKQVNHLDLYLDSKFLEGNVTLVDTPGLNGIAEGHKEITMEQIERSSAGIFMFNANKPGSRSDFDFLTELRKKVNGSSIILLLNMIDTIKKSEGETVDTVIQKLKDNYRKVYPDIKTLPEIWPVAAYPALISRSKMDNFDYNGKNGAFSEEEKKKFEDFSQMKAFEDRLWKFLTQGEKAKQELHAPVSQLISQLTSLRDNINLQLDVLNGSVDKGAIEEQKLVLDKALEELNEKLSSLTREMKKEVSEAEGDFIHDVRAGIEKFGEQYTNVIMDFDDIEEIDSANVSNYIQKKLQTIVMDAYEDYCGRIRDIMANNAADITNDLNQSLSDNIKVKINSELEIKSVKTGLEEFEKTCAEYKKRIKEQEQLIDNSEDDLIKVMAAKRKKESLQNQLNSKIEAMQSFEENYQMYMPKNEKVQGTPYVMKIGIFKRTVVYPEVIDDSARKQYIENQKAIRQSYEEQISSIENQINSIPNDDVEIYQKLFERKQRICNELKAELNAYQEKFAADIKIKCKTALENAKKTILKFLSDTKEDYIKEVKADFIKRRALHVDTMEQLIGQSVIRNIELKKQEIEMLENKLRSAVEERDLSVQKLNEQLSVIKDLLRKALDLESDIESIHVDVIKEQEM